MFYFEFKIAVESIYNTFIARQRFKCDWINKISGILGHNNMNTGTGLYKTAGKHGTFICSNPTGNT